MIKQIIGNFKASQKRIFILKKGKDDFCQSEQSSDLLINYLFLALDLIAITFVSFPL
jgi:hypothetical protein